MPEIHLRLHGFTYSACRPFTKNRERTQKFKWAGHSSYICQNELDKACLQHDMAYGGFKSLPKRRVSDKVLPDKLFNITKNSNYDGYQWALTAWKVSKHGVISSPYFPVFGRNTETYGVNLHIQFKYREIWTRNNSVFGHFSRSV